ncbi:phage virion morphogenesis protein [Sorangium sp. So ce1024]|uniref:phage virion morphogenesis protein n=1 Tax=Sorangium sp. So ce1024 TaxID=3133327 RepID=UPI003F0A8F6D
MSASFDAPTDELEALADRLESVADGSGLQDLFLALAEEGRTLVIERFEAQADPEGVPWAPRNEMFGRRTGGQIMRDTHRFQNSFVAEPTSDGFRVGSNFIGARVLTEGATITPKSAPRLKVPLAVGGFAFLKSAKIPGRRVIPVGEAGPIWGPRLIEAIEDYGAEVLGSPS